MPNQLPKNQNQSNFTGFNNEKHLNLLDNLPNFEKSQENRLVNFIFILSIFLGISVSVVNYINLTQTNKFEVSEEVLIDIEKVKSKEGYIFELEKDIEYLNKYKEAKNSIKLKQGTFFEQISILIENLGKPSIESINYTKNNNQYNFSVAVFLDDEKIEEKLKDIQNKNKKITNLKIETIEKISDLKETKYKIIGEIDGR